MQTQSPVAALPLTPGARAPGPIAAAEPPAPAPAAREKSPAPGISCPLCGGPLDSVLFTRKAVGQILRVRKCGPCKRRWRTAETIVAGKPQARGEKPVA